LGRCYANWGQVLVQAAHVVRDQSEKLSLLRESVDKFDRSARAVSNVAATYSMWGVTLLELGKVSRVRGDLREALDKLKTSLTLKSDDPSTLYNLACAHALLESPEPAVETLKKCFEYDRAQSYRKMAHEDIDLASLRGNRSFENLFAPTPPPNLPSVSPPVRN
jgi:tetratricopeptide (TPR) repeat protein